jgi:2-isopropylmalate synthase
MKNIKILDTTLRDGMQTPYVGVAKEGRKHIAKAIAETEADIIEIGFAANWVDYAWMPSIVQRILSTQKKCQQQSQICGLARLVEDDINKTYEALAEVPEGQRRIHLYVGTSEVLRKKGLRKSDVEVFEMIQHHVEYAKQRIGAGTIQFSPEDAARENSPEQYDFLCRCIRVACQAGADVINIPDTTGWCVPEDYGTLIKRIGKDIPDIRELSVHLHNDDGMAVAKTLRGIMSGATQVEGTVLGLGERAGNVDWMIVAANLYMHKNYNAKTNVVFKQFKKAAHDVARYTDIRFPRNHPVIGRAAHVTSSGTHVNAIIADRQSYNILPSEKVGYKQRIVLGQTSGTKAVAAYLVQEGMPMPENLEGCTDSIKWYCANHKGRIPHAVLSRFVTRHN